MKTYLKLNAENNLFTIEEELNSNKFKIGTTYEDYLVGAYVELSDDQIRFMQAHPNATIKEIIELKLVTNIAADEVDIARKNKLQELFDYDNSPAVNSFTINKTILAWFTPAERNNYKQSIEAAKLLSKDKLTFIVNNNILEVSTRNAEIMLAMIQDYADQCYIQTVKHRFNIESLTNVDDIKGYDYTINYPDKLDFTI